MRSARNDRVTLIPRSCIYVYIFRDVSGGAVEEFPSSREFTGCLSPLDVSGDVSPSIDSHPSIMSLTGVVIFRVNSACRQCRVSGGLNAPMTVAPDETARHACNEEGCSVTWGSLKTPPYTRIFPSPPTTFRSTLDLSLASHFSSREQVYSTLCAVFRKKHLVEIEKRRKAR